MKGLAPHTGSLIEALSRLECIKPYTLVGGTALSIQLGTRQSEDLDFQLWRESKDQKMEVMLRRHNFRDYYDVYSILMSGIDLQLLIDKALKYSRFRLKTKNVLAILTKGDFFTEDSNFPQLMPKYNVTAEDIEDYIKRILLK